jgi:pimeloyl-ACP methyl ester carboxylesterase
MMTGAAGEAAADRGVRRTSIAWRDASVELVDLGGAAGSGERVAPGRRPTILFLHGDDGVDAALPLLVRLAEAGRVIAPSHPGFGRSSLPPHFRSVDDLAYFHLDLLERLDLRDVVLVGASFGGWIAAEIAVRNASRLSALVLCGALGIRIADDETVPDILDLFTAPQSEIDRGMFADPQQWQRGSAGVSDEALYIEARDRESFCLFGWSPLLHNPRLRHWLHRIPVPALVLWGERDGIVSPDYGRAYAAAIPGARFALVPGTAHRCYREKPDLVASHIRDFVQGACGAPAALRA